MGILLGLAIGVMATGVFMERKLNHCRRLAQHEYYKACVSHTQAAKVCGVDTNSQNYVAAVVRAEQEYEKREPKPDGPERSIWGP